MIAQNINTLLGKILRINIDPPAGSPTPYISPADNPFFGLTAGRDEIFAYGMRNPWRFSFDRLTGQQWVGDVGQGAREEVDTPIVKGGNYGWRIYEGNACTGNDPSLCNPGPFEFPLFEYTHVSGRCSLTGGYVYRGPQDSLPDDMYVNADFCTGEIFGWNGSTQQVLLDTTMSISSFGEDEQGEIYVVNLGGSVSRITAIGPPPPSSWTFIATPSTVSAGQSSVLSFTTTTTDFHRVFIGAQRPSYTCGASSCSGSLTVTPSQTTTYSLTSSNATGVPWPPRTVTVTVSTPPGPAWTFTANPSSIQSGQSSVLSFTTTTSDVHRVFINGQRPSYTCSASSCSGSLTVNPTQTTTYTLTSINSAGTPHPAMSAQIVVTSGAP